jgi:hypothetical protein
VSNDPCLEGSCDPYSGCVYNNVCDSGDYNKRKV